MASKLFIVGQPNSPVDGQSTFYSNFLGCNHVDFILIDNVPITPIRDFSQSLDSRQIDISPIVFQDKSYVIFNYSPIKCQD